MNHEVIIVEYELDKHGFQDPVAKALAEYLDEGYTIVGQSQNARHLTYTLVKVVPISLNKIVTNTAHQGVSYH